MFGFRFYSSSLFTDNKATYSYHIYMNMFDYTHMIYYVIDCYFYFITDKALPANKVCGLYEVEQK